MENLINKNNLTTLTMINTIKVSSRGQIVIPEEMRNKLNIKEGSRLVMQEQENRLIIELEDEFLNKINELKERKESFGWTYLAQESFREVWDNKEDEKTWKKYLKKI